MYRHAHPLLLALIVLIVAACSSAPIQDRRELILQDPLPGHAIVYLIRAPNDSESIDVHVGDFTVVALPSGTYTVASVPPGQVQIWSSSKGVAERYFEVKFLAGERRFFYVSGANSNTIGNPSIVALVGGPLMAALNRTDTEDGSRSWKECNELDARGLISIARLVLPN